MRAFADYNPAVTTAYFAFVSGIAMFCTEPLILALSLLGSVLLFALRRNEKRVFTHLYMLLLFAAATLINPLFNHNGATVLFVLNNNPVTLEALAYGCASAAMLVSVLYWFFSLSRIMTSDKLLYLFGALSPKLALMLSFILRRVPLYATQFGRVKNTQKAMGLYKDDSIFDRLKSGMNVFSATVTWAIENGIVTADGMTARGYGIGRRSSFSVYRFRTADFVMLATITVLFALVCAAKALGCLEVSFYPSIIFENRSLLSVTAYVAYGILAFLPSAIEISEGVRWKYLLLKI